MIKNKNTGLENTGHYNHGNFNTGSLNMKDRNSGDYNHGSMNAGNRNLGNFNTGDFNMGSYNTGWFNLSDSNTGVFCVQNKKIDFFDKPSEYTLTDWWESDACRLLSRIRTVFWIKEEHMTLEERVKNKNYNTYGGYLKKINFKNACTKFWNELSAEDKKIITSMPNFDSNIFFRVTGIKAVAK